MFFCVGEKNVVYSYPCPKCGEMASPAIGLSIEMDKFVKNENYFRCPTCRYSFSSRMVNPFGRLLTKEEIAELDDK
jgi:DNA-directed RNA polymerase subunit RPC12/RpoP